ncbi:uncharacterized protein LOC132294192 [Cornus florida]|uniref:uncharacterized protein LOC132294192 n=1 Tax=Cornus florida TaxID=4283 RepID=UPI00289E51FB|nr:uncharacterized protein LOC132294192 [Cornus florida]
MENNSYTTSYAESGDSSPRSREIELENPPPWEEQPPSSNNYKVKFMCSYGGKIHPRPHDNQLTYVGGETKILAVDRSIKFPGIISKLSALCDADVCFKYQLPGEDLDALISVTNDDDLDHMMHEYDRLYRATAKPARLRLFLFQVNPPPATPSSLASNEGKLDREQFVDALNSVPVQSSTPPSTVAPPNHMDFLFGLEKGMLPPVVAKLQDQIPEPVPPIPLLVPAVEDRVIGSDPIQRQIQDLQRLQIEVQEQARKFDDQMAGGFNRDYYVQKMSENLPPSTLPVTVPGTMSLPPQYWPEKQIMSGGFPATTIGTDQPVYMIPAPAGMYHTPIARPVTGPTGQGYYAVQRMPPEVYRDQTVYGVMPPPAAAPPTLPPQVPKMAAYTEGIGMVRPPTPTTGVVDTGYTQVAYDNGMGRQVYYTAPGVVMPPQYQGMAAPGVSAEMRPTLTEEANVVATKVSQALV